MIYFLGLLGHLKSKHPQYIEKFEQKKAEVKAMRAGRRSFIRKRKEEEEDILDSVNLEADYSSWSPSGSTETFEIGEATVDFYVNGSVLFSHNFYRKGNIKDLAECLMCRLAGIQTLLKTTDGNTTGKLSTNNF